MLLQVLIMLMFIVFLVFCSIPNVSLHSYCYSVHPIFGVYCVATSVHHVVFSLSMVSTTPTLAFFYMLEFC
jgi:hypothetical protein